MREIDSQSKARVVPVAIVAGLGMAGMGLVSEGVVVADTTSVTDTLRIGVEETCTFKNTTDATFAGSALNGSEVENFNDSGVHTFYLFCNNNNGYTVRATPYDLEATNTDDVISYTNNYTHTGVSGMWTAEIATSESGVTVTSPVPVGGGVVISSNTHSSASTSFTATYRAYVGTETSAGTYTGRIEYVLSSLNGTASNGGGSGSGSGSGGTGQNNDNGGTDSGSEVTDDTNNGGDSGNSGSGDAGSNGTNSGDSNGTQNSLQNVSPTTLNNTYNTYNTYNTTNTYGGTTNYSGGGTSAPVVLNMQGTTNGDTDDLLGEVNETTTISDDDNSGASANYEKPLGVTTTTTSSSNEDSGMDWVPLAVTAGALAVAGVAAVAVAQKDKEKE